MGLLWRITLFSLSVGILLINRNKGQSSGFFVTMAEMPVTVEHGGQYESVYFELFPGSWLRDKGGIF